MAPPRTGVSTSLCAGAHSRSLSQFLIVYLVEAPPANQPETERRSAGNARNLRCWMRVQVFIRALYAIHVIRALYQEGHEWARMGWWARMR